MKGLVIKEIEKRNPDYLIMASERGSVFNDPLWLNIFGNKLKLYGILDNQKTLVGAFSLLHTRIFGLPYLKNALTSPHNGLIYRTDANPVYKRNSFIKALHSCVADFLRSQRAAIIQFGLPSEETDVQAYLWKGFKVSPSYTYRLDLNQSIEELLHHLDPKVRSDINKAQKDSIRVEKSEDVSVIMHLVRKTFEKNRQKVPLNIFERILNEFVTPENSFSFIAFQDKTPISVVTCVHDSNTAWYIIGGTDPQVSHRGAGSSAMLASIHHAKEIGLEVFDFEGSMIPSIESYFRGFGGELVPKFTVHRAWLPLEVVLKLVKREVY